MAVEPSGAKGVAMMVNVPWVLNIPMNMGEGASSKTRVYNVYTFLSKHVGEYDDKPRDSRFSDQCIVWTWVVVSKCVGNIPSPDSSGFIDIIMNEGTPFGDDHTTSMAQMVDEIIRYQANIFFRQVWKARVSWWKMFTPLCQEKDRQRKHRKTGWGNHHWLRMVSSLAAFALMSVPLMHRPDVLHPILWGLPTRQTTATHRVKGSLTTTTSVLIPRGAWEYNMTHQLRSSVVRGCPNTTWNRFAGMFAYQHQEDGQWMFHLIICCNMLQFK